MNLSHPKSHCPNCKTEISVWDNIPILGWIKLRGKCRNCQCSISPRYPLVEAAVGCIVVSIFLGELLRGCCNLPFHSYAHHTHSFMSDIVWELRVDLILISIIHAYLIVILLVFALISMDERAVPHRLIQRSMIFVFLTGVIFSDIYPLPFHEPFDYDHGMFRLSELKNPWPANYEKDYLDPHWNIIGESIINLLLGMFIGMLLSVIWKFRDQHTWSIPKLFGMQSMMLLTGAYLGWQAVIMIFSTYQFLRLLIETLGLFRTKIPAYMTHQLGFVLLTLLFILNWNTCWNLIGATHSS